MKQTAVEWLAEQMLHPESHNPYIEQALEMEKQQIIDAYALGYDELGEQYYKQTYKSE